MFQAAFAASFGEYESAELGNQQAYISYILFTLYSRNLELGNNVSLSLPQPRLSFHHQQSASKTQSTHDPFAPVPQTHKSIPLNFAALVKREQLSIHRTQSITQDGTSSIFDLSATCIISYSYTKANHYTPVHTCICQIQLWLLFEEEGYLPILREPLRAR
jgi:hypothetical protein